MITSVLRTHLDEKWDDCWPVSTLRPLAMLDLLSYVFFVKKVFDKELVYNKYPGRDSNNFIYSEDLQDFTWSSLRNMDTRQIHGLFTGKHGIIDLMVQYGKSGSLYNEFFKTPPLLTPTARLLFNIIQIINIIETSDKNIQAFIGIYLINKVDIIAQNGQVQLPENIAWLMTETADPDSKDIIIDPLAGNGNLLINAARHITNKNNSINSEIKAEPDTGILKGLESDLVQIRIAGFNMMLQGIKNPHLEILNFLPDKILHTNQKATLLISNLFFTEVESNLPTEANDGAMPVSRKDIFFLKLILKNMEVGCRAVVLVPEFFLFSNDPYVTDIRREIIDKNKLEGVISLSVKSNSIISRAGILIFNKYQSITTENVWFFKMKPGKEKEGITEHNSDNNMRHNVLDFSKSDGVNDILYKWKNRKTSGVSNPDISYYITAHDIIANNYILNFDDYKTLVKKREAEKKIADELNTTAAINKYPENNIEEGLLYEKRKSKRKIVSAVIAILLIALTATGIYFINFKNPASSLINVNGVTDSISGSGNDDTSSNEKSPGMISEIQTSAKKTLIEAPIKNNRPGLSQTNLSKGYSVIDTAYFYKTPDATDRKSLYLVHRDKYVLHPTREQNGYVYIIYINKKGKSTRGWIKKEDLQPVQ